MRVTLKIRPWERVLSALVSNSLKFYYFYLHFHSSNIVLSVTVNNQTTFSWPHETPTGHNQGVPVWKAPCSHSACSFSLSSFSTAEGFMQSDIDWRSVDPFSGWNLKIWYLCPVNAQKKWVAKFSNLTQCRTNQKENWVPPPHPRFFNRRLKFTLPCLFCGVCRG